MTGNVQESQRKGIENGVTNTEIKKRPVMETEDEGMLSGTKKELTVGKREGQKVDIVKTRTKGKRGIRKRVRINRETMMEVKIDTRRKVGKRIGMNVGRETEIRKERNLNIGIGIEKEGRTEIEIEARTGTRTRMTGIGTKTGIAIEREVRIKEETGIGTKKERETVETRIEREKKNGIRAGIVRKIEMTETPEGGIKKQEIIEMKEREEVGKGNLEITEKKKDTRKNLKEKLIGRVRTVEEKVILMMDERER